MELVGNVIEPGFDLALLVRVSLELTSENYLNQDFELFKFKFKLEYFSDSLITE